ncbi:protein FAR1-RELATED SEQUENCE 7 isoform X2 [Gossypium raimondii]|nr:protein FAR1-RELATED SEQUENCE 7 isoform X2 [Gossypium raimondii]
MGDEVDSTSATGFILGDEFALENYYIGFGLMEDQDDHVPFPLLTNQEPHQPLTSLDRECNNNGAALHGSSDRCSAVSGPLSFTTTHGPDLDDQQLTLPGIAEIAITQHHQQHGQKMENSAKHQLSCGTHSSSLDSDGYDTASSESVWDEMLQQSKLKIDHQISIQAPELGMEFSSEEDAYKFYKDYAKATGFSVRKGKYQWSSNGTARKRTFLCSNEGFRLSKTSSSALRYRRKETRTGCGAMVQITNETEKWMISRLVLKHNHSLVEGSYTRNRQALEDHWTKRTMGKTRMAQKAGDAICAKVRNADFSSHLSYLNQCNLNPEDIQGLINYFKQQQLEDPSFFYTLQVDAKSSLISFIWRDGRSKTDYQHFGDVVVLDTTFRVGSEGMICAPLLGLNHHRQYVLLGCALLLDESLDSFMWLFGTLMAAMDGLQPKTILTNECQAMADAIKEVLPDTQHHLGMWYIQQTIEEYLPEPHHQSAFRNLLDKCIFDCQSEEEFDMLWNSLVDQYKLHENERLKTLYMLRKKWSPVFARSTFFAGIQSADGCKAIRTIFQSLMKENMTLLKFAHRYQTVAKEQRTKEIDDDLCCKKMSPLMILKGSTLEKQAADVYTYTIFKLFQDELRGCLSVAIKDMGKTGTVASFKLKEEGQKDNIVKFCDSSNQITCSCKKYESMGILCVHILKVLNAKNVFKLPSQYILKRWTKSATDGNVLNHQKSLKVKKLMQKALHVITKSLASEDSYKIVEDSLDIVLGKVENVLKTKHDGHRDKAKDVEILNACNEGLETQTVLSAPPFQKEEAEHRIRSKSKRKLEDDVSEISCKSMDDCVLHSYPPRKATKGANNEGARAVSSHSYFAGDFLQQPACISPRPPLPSPSTVHQFKGFSKPMGNFQERKKQAQDVPVSRREMETMEMTIMARMKEMQEGILRAINETVKS